MNVFRTTARIVSGAVMMTALSGIAPGSHAQTAAPPYTLTLFPGTPPAGATAPDDLAISANGTHLWGGYGNGGDTTGKGGPSSLVEYDLKTGAVLKNISIPGHLDGLKIHPVTGDVWATENEDGNPTLAVIDHHSGAFNVYKFAPDLITGGFDDLVFVKKPGGGFFRDDSEVDVYVVTSSQVDTSKPAVVLISGPLRATGTQVKSVLPGAPQTVWNVVTNQPETTDMIADPDSMTIDPAGELVLDNRSDDSLYILRNSKAQNPILRVPLTLGGAAVEVNDTIFTSSETTGASSTAGTIFITDTSANKIYMLTKPYFPANEIYTAANVANVLGLVDLNTGVVSEVASGFKGIHGLAFSPIRVNIRQTDREDRSDAQ
jgi:hypothetical protein